MLIEPLLQTRCLGLARQRRELQQYRHLWRRVRPSGQRIACILSGTQQVDGQFVRLTRNSAGQRV